MPWTNPRPLAEKLHLLRLLHWHHCMVPATISSVQSYQTIVLEVGEYIVTFLFSTCLVSRGGFHTFELVPQWPAIAPSFLHSQGTIPAGLIWVITLQHSSMICNRLHCRVCAPVRFVCILTALLPQSMMVCLLVAGGGGRHKCLAKCAWYVFYCISKYSFSSNYVRFACTQFMVYL